MTVCPYVRIFSKILPQQNTVVVIIIARDVAYKDTKE
jgi:hypothetical protein